MKQLQSFGTLLLAFLLVFLANRAEAQLVDRSVPEPSHWGVNLTSGAMVVQPELLTAGRLTDDQAIFEEYPEAEATLGLGADLNYRTALGFTVGGQFVWSGLEENFQVTFTDQPQADDQPLLVNRGLNLYFYNASIGYEAKLNRLGMYGTVGFGGATQTFETNGSSDGTPTDLFAENESITAWQSPITLGAKYAFTSNVIGNLMARDYIIYGNNKIEGATNNFYFGAGLSFAF